MTWNWELPDWPRFSFDASLLKAAEERLLKGIGYLQGLLDHVPATEQTEIRISTLSEEAFKTSEIEGERLDRDSLQSSIRRNFGLTVVPGKFRRAEQGVADLMTSLYASYDQPLTHDMLFGWHRMLLAGDRSLQDIGRYRTHASAMQVVSGTIDRPKIHYEAPPSGIILQEMAQFISWFNDTSPNGSHLMPALARAGLVHFYFVCVHPFEDGNGRIGRALVLKALCQNADQPLLLALSHTIQQNKKSYYEALQKNNRTLDVTSWQRYFAEMILEALVYSQKLVEFVIHKAAFYRRVSHLLNDRQKAAIERVLRDGPDSFPLGLNAEKYIRITGTSRATATRDLQDLVEKGIVGRTGEKKSTRYRVLFEDAS